MRRVFGKKKAAAPAPSLDEASSGLGGRLDSMDKKIADLETELRGYKDKIKKTNSPAAKKQLQKRALEVLKRKRMYEQQRDTVAGRSSVRASPCCFRVVNSALICSCVNNRSTVQYRPSFFWIRVGESEYYHCCCNESSKR